MLSLKVTSSLVEFWFCSKLTRFAIIVLDESELLMIS